MSNALNTIGQCIKHRLIDLEKSHTRLAEQIGYGRDRHQTVSNWCNDSNDTIHILMPVCRALTCLLMAAHGQRMPQ